MVETTRDTPGLFRRLWRSVGTDRIKLQRFGLNAYGKLPIYKDFISTGLTDPAAREFRTWLDRAFSHRWSVDENYRDVEIAPHSFLFRLTDGKGYVAGSLWGSTDEGGLRRFPFTLFISFSAGQAAADPLTAVEYLSLLEARARDLRERFGAGGSLASLHQTYRGASIECPLKTREQIRREIQESEPGVAVSTFAESILGAAGPSAWSSLLEELSGGPASDRVGAIRLPLGGALARHRELEFWLLWCELQERMKRRPPCGILYPSGAVLGRASFLFRDLKPEDIFLLHSARVAGMDVLELPAIPAPSAEPAPAPVPPSEARALAAVESLETEEPPVATSLTEKEFDAAHLVAATEAEPAPSVAEEAAALDVPFLEAEAPASEDCPGPSGLAAEPLLVDSAGRPRLTQAPFRPSAELPIPEETVPAPVVAIAAAEPAGTIEDPEPAAITASAGSIEMPEPDAATEEGVSPHPASADVSAVTPATAAPSSADGEEPVRDEPSGWNRPLFALVEQ